MGGDACAVAIVVARHGISVLVPHACDVCREVAAGGERKPCSVRQPIHREIGLAIAVEIARIAVNYEQAELLTTEAAVSAAARPGPVQCRRRSASRSTSSSSHRCKAGCQQVGPHGSPLSISATGRSALATRSRPHELGILSRRNLVRRLRDQRRMAAAVIIAVLELAVPAPFRPAPARRGRRAVI